jgi:serine/threonine protein kinase
MSEPAPTGDWPALPGAESRDWPEVPGYEILAELGRGGMGIVYQARQLSLNRLVALKMIRGGAFASPQERYRFRVEAQAAAHLRHPNVVPILEVGEHAGLPYFAMEFVDGGSLDTHLAGRAQPPTEAAELIRTLAFAVQAAHDQKIIHRDLKPGNILLRRQSAHPPTSKFDWAPDATDSGLVHFSPMIADFGLAKRLDSESTAWTQDGAILGTADYMAPEQAAGRAHEVGPAVDVYALGAILYELLTGRPPFQTVSRAQTFHRVLHEEPAPPGRLISGVPRDLETVCLKCLEKDPSRRYARALDLAEDLGRFLGGSAVVAVPLAPLERLTRQAARDGYHLVGEIGRGPRSTVYHARCEPLKQPVALKVFAAGTCTREEWEARLRHSAELWGTLAHPQLMAVQRAGWWDGAPYLALEYVPQGSLADKIAGQSFTVPLALRLVEQLAEVVAYLHRQGVMHGNLKPSNVLMAADGIPRIADLRLFGGLFQGPLPAEDDQAVHLAYLPPELLQDPRAEARPFTDVYGLGLILYELLAGRPAFSGRTVTQVLDQVRSQDPPPLSQLKREVTPQLERFCLVCLRKNPWRRFVRAHDVATGARRYLEESAKKS